MPYKDLEAKRAQNRAWTKAKRLQWTDEERERHLAYNRAYYAAHKDELAAKAKVYNAARKEETKIKSRAYYAAHKREINARSNAYKKAKKAELAAKALVYKAENKETIAAKKRAYRLAHKEEIAASFRAYAETHKQELTATARRYRATHPETFAAKHARRRARKAQATVNDLTAAQWEEIKAAYGYRCVYCGRKMQRLTQDHIIPFANGGTHTFSNVVPACQSCNSKKGARQPLVPVQPLLLTIAPTKKKQVS